MYCTLHGLNADTNKKKQDTYLKHNGISDPGFLWRLEIYCFKNNVYRTFFFIKQDCPHKRFSKVYDAYRYQLGAEYLYKPL